MLNATESIPEGMPHTNRLDRMTTQQAKWAIQNGDAWNAYLKEQLASGADVNLVAHEAKLAYEPPTPAETFEAICEIVESVWLDLTDNLKRKTLRDNQIDDWAEVLHWAIKALPTGYEGHRDIFEDALRGHQTELNKREVKP